jgi:N-acetylglucosamine-6-phosphate deacetylase
LLGQAGVFGTIEPGLAADLVVLDEQLNVSGVLAAGAWSNVAQSPVHRPSSNGRDVTKLVQTNSTTGLDH